jgi:hypothetical protein
MSVKTAIIDGKVTRLRVFNAVKNFMIAEMRCPDATDINEALGLPVNCVLNHMVALQRADGLPMPITPGKYRSVEAAAEHKRGAAKRYYDENKIPLDELIAQNLF